MPRVPTAQTVPDANERSYPSLSMIGRPRSASKTTEAPMIPVLAASRRPIKETEIANPPLMLPKAFVVGTAGHIDHGKTSLVRALTGIDLDRLPEEKERGITIALGFTALELPGGRIASFVDCPGHERLVRTMIAGATGIDAVMLCVSSVEGVMPQTREHLDILQLLGIQHGVVVLTMCDLADEEMRELAAEDVRDAIEGPTTQILVEGCCFSEHGHHIGDLVQVPVVERPVE